MDFKDQVVVITGSSQGFGYSLAQSLAALGAQVIISSEDSFKLRQAASNAKLDSFVADVTSRDDLQELVQYVIKTHGRIDVWVNNAGIQIAPSNLEDIDPAKLRRLFDINVFGYFYGCQVVVPVMKRQGSGIIVNINSTAGLGGKPEIAAYVASKFAIKGLTLSLREELKATQIKVYGIHPGGMQTEIYKDAYPTDFDEYMSVDYAIQKVLNNFSAPDPELDLIIPRP